MIDIYEIKKARDVIKKWKSQGYSIGFVPTMGFLHNGHKSLIEKARQENDRVVVSIFVNPIQFGPSEDFEKYPRDLKLDFNISSEAGADLVFVPSVKEIFPNKNLAFVDIEKLGDGLCGATRKNHFRGVCTIVAKLFNIITPDRSYFGQKDAQQLAIIKTMASDLNFETEIIACPIIREEDGLAMSSRNSYLSKEQRQAALVISKSLNIAKKMLEDGQRDAQSIKKVIEQSISNEPLAKINYIDIVDERTLETVDEIISGVLVAVAVYIGETRLIDNFIFKEV
jgi:pantoate--beta-alanine ligase